MKLFKQTPVKKFKAFVKKTIKPFRKREFIVKFVTVIMAVAFLAGSILPYLFS